MGLRAANVLWETFFYFANSVSPCMGIYIYIKTEVSLGFLSSYKFGFNFVFFVFLFFSLNRRRY